MTYCTQLYRIIVWQTTESWTTMTEGWRIARNTSIDKCSWWIDCIPSCCVVRHETFSVVWVVWRGVVCRSVQPFAIYLFNHFGFYLIYWMRSSCHFNTSTNDDLCIGTMFDASCNGSSKATESGTACMGEHFGNWGMSPRMIRLNGPIVRDYFVQNRLE